MLRNLLKGSYRRMDMENRYLFRAKTKLIVGTYNSGKEEGEWVKGYLRCDCGKWTVFQFEYDRANYIAYEVDPSTICQCTGLKDKNGKLIWENDIIKYHFGSVYAPIKYGEYQSCFDSTSTGHIGFYVDWKGTKKDNMRKDLGYWINMISAEVVGNIFDNPELLEK